MLSLDEAEPARPHSFGSEDALGQQLQDLERWVQANERRERRAALRFWTLRVPALCCAVLAVASGPFGIAAALPGLGAAVALLLVVDAAFPGATWHGPLHRALHDLRQLQNTVKLKWDRVRLSHPDPASSQRVAYALAILDVIYLKREAIGRYLTGCVASPSVGDRPF